MIYDFIKWLINDPLASSFTLLFLGICIGMLLEKPSKPRIKPCSDENHNFQPRSDSRSPTPEALEKLKEIVAPLIEKGYTPIPMDVYLNAIGSEIYVHDVCVTCGKIAERGVKRPEVGP